MISNSLPKISLTNEKISKSVYNKSHICSICEPVLMICVSTYSWSCYLDLLICQISYFFKLFAGHYIEKNL